MTNDKAQLTNDKSGVSTPSGEDIVVNYTVETFELLARLPNTAPDRYEPDDDDL